MDLKSIASGIDPRYGTGTTRVWYMRREFFSDGCMGADWLAERGLMPKNADLEKTHICVGTVDEADPDVVFEMMQGERWSPKGEARPFIKRLGLGHTSMGVGDIVEVDGQPMLVDRVGFSSVL